MTTVKHPEGRRKEIFPMFSSFVCSFARSFVCSCLCLFISLFNCLSVWNVSHICEVKRANSKQTLTRKKSTNLLLSLPSNCYRFRLQKERRFCKEKKTATNKKHTDTKKKKNTEVKKKEIQCATHKPHTQKN